MIPQDSAGPCWWHGEPLDPKRPIRAEVEAVARALCRAHGDDPDRVCTTPEPTSTATGPRWWWWLAPAVVAVAALSRMPKPGAAAEEAAAPRPGGR